MTERYEIRETKEYSYDVLDHLDRGKRVANFLYFKDAMTFSKAGVAATPMREALQQIVARTYSSDRRCRLEYEPVAEICDIAQAALAAAATPGRETLDDIRSHHPVWKQALEGARDHALRCNDPDDAAYWRHEITVLDRVFGAVSSDSRPEPAAAPPNGRHYLSAIRKRLEQLYDASVDNPRLREQLSDEVDWVDEQLEGRAIAKEPGNRFCKHDDCPYPDCLVEGGICPSQPTLVSRPDRGGE